MAGIRVHDDGLIAMAERITVGNVIAVANRVTAGDMDTAGNVITGAMTIEVPVEVVDGTGAG